MLIRLSINNYVLIDKLSIDFNEGFTAITGETGAGKSILIGALGLILGERADTQSLGNTKEKCVIEGEFLISKYNLKDFFDSNDLDYSKNTLLRREITQNGRSRAFINDTPVTLNLLKELGSFLIDIHSQHQTLLLNKQDYQLKIIDAFCQHETLLKDFKENFNLLAQKKAELENLKELEKNTRKELDYKQYLLDEIVDLKLNLSKDLEIDLELNQLQNFEELQLKLSHALELTETADNSILSLLTQLNSNLKSIEGKDNLVYKLNQRIKELTIEFKDCIDDLYRISSNYEGGVNLGRLNFLIERNNAINKLLHKHSLLTIEQLVSFKETLSDEIDNITSIDSNIKIISEECFELQNKCTKLAKQLSKNRTSSISNIENQIGFLMQKLGMPNSILKIKTSNLSELSKRGFDEFTFVFSANKGVEAKEISKIASGGELSRLMLCFKYILAKHSTLSSILFDEIDTGVSGEIAHKMADFLLEMSSHLQVISITHLPQIAAMGKVQLLVSKKEVGQKTVTFIQKLDDKERIYQLAKMLSGKIVTDSSLKNAEDLLNT